MKKKKKEMDLLPFIEEIREKITVIFMAYMLVVFPLYIHNNYIDIAPAKQTIFIYGMIPYDILMIILLIPTIIAIVGRKKRLSVDKTDWIMLALVASFCIGFIWCMSKYNSFWGAGEKNTGLLMYVLAGITIIFLSNNFSWNVFLIWSLLIGSGAVYVLEVLNRFGVDPLHMYSNLAEYQVTQFITTLGQFNYSGAFDCIMVSITMVLFCICKQMDSKIVYGLCMVLGFMGGIASCADGFYLGVIMTFMFMFGYAIYKNELFTRIYASMLLLICSLIIIRIIYQYVGKSELMWGASLTLISNKLLALELIFALVCGIALYAFNKCFVQKRRLNSTNLDFRKKLIKIYAIAICIAIVVFLIFCIFNTIVLQKNNPDAESIFCFNENWGTGRGLIFKKSWLTFWNSSLIYKLFGYGFNIVSESITYVLGDSYASMKYCAGQVIFDAHNIYLNTLVTSGLIGCALWAAYLGITFYRAVKYVWQHETAMIVLVGIAVICAQGMVNGPQAITTPVILVAFGVFAGIIKNIMKSH